MLQSKAVLFVGFFYLWSTIGYSQGVNTDEKTFNQIFEGNLTQSKTNITESRTPASMEVSYANLTFEGLQFENDYYQISATKQVSNNSMANFNFSHILLKKFGIDIGSELGLGYYYDESVMQVTSKKGGTYKDVVKLQMAPIRAGIVLAYQLPFLRPVKLFGKTQLQYTWVNIAGDLDGMNQSHWVPGYRNAVGLNLFEADQTDLKSWFGGVSLSANASGSTGDQAVETTSYELGLRFLL